MSNVFGTRRLPVWIAGVAIALAVAILAAGGGRTLFSSRPADPSASAAPAPGPPPVSRGQALEIDAAALERLLALDPHLLLVDVRPPGELAGPLGRIPEAVNIPLPAVIAHPEMFAPRQTLVFVCEAGVRSLRAAKALAARGRIAYSLKGGLRAWRSRRPSAGSTPAPSGTPPPEGGRPGGAEDPEGFFGPDMGC